MLDTTEENEFENTIEVFLESTEMVVEAEIVAIVKVRILGEFRQSKKAAGSAAPSNAVENFGKVRRRLVVQHLECGCSSFELYSLIPTSGLDAMFDDSYWRKTIRL